MEWTAVIPNWNGARFLPRLMESLVRQTLPATRILVVDNGSTDGSAEAARSAGAEIVPLHQNTGFAHAVNRGIQLAESPMVAVLNNDVELDPDWSGHLSEALSSDPELRFATGKIYTVSGENILDGAFDNVSRGACPWRCGHGRTDSATWNERRRIWSAPFTAAMFDRSLFATLGLLDERFESYLEDVDFGLRCALGGFQGLYVPEAIAKHWGSATLGVWHPETVRRMARNQVFLVARHYPEDWPLRYGWPVLAGQLLWGLVALRHGHGAPWVRGKWEGIRRFKELRSPTPPGREFDVIISASEDEIRRLQMAEAPDTYWKLYFWIT